MLDGRTTNSQSQFQRRNNRWVVTDSQGEVHARVFADTREQAERMAWAVLPELRGAGSVVEWHKATDVQRGAAKKAFAIDQRVVERTSSAGRVR